MEYNIITCLTKSCLHTFVEKSFSLLRMTTVFLKWRHPQQEQTKVGPSAISNRYLRISDLSSPRIVLYLSNSARLCLIFSLESLRFSVTSFSWRSLYFALSAGSLSLSVIAALWFALVCSRILELICNSGIMFSSLSWILELFLVLFNILYKL